ncbi:hypothetical protein HYH03_009135 [Edaphochlamys debaryana]|uniref:Peptidase M48 domain-containing protein n=1 Tax=Edaphochlamys debaryana TaxID=47281 RepID=A0A835XX47_9CHLO|nr:hypothetical protein HYH03_009135 [Edaphochlamys debaryana]|eukprot:KAG2492722.1 hypothetical protein HYH03_009135 [Edaphochlamys debaryana]
MATIGAIVGACKQHLPELDRSDLLGATIVVASAPLVAGLGLYARRASLPLAKVPFTPRSHKLVFVHEYSMALSEAGFRAIRFTSWAAGTLLDRNSSDQLLVQGIFDDILSAASWGLGGISPDDVKSYKWEIITVRDAAPGAFACASGKVVITTGMLRLLRDRPGCIAHVIAHEVAHVLARHVSEKIAHMAAGNLAVLTAMVLADSASAADRNGVPYWEGSSDLARFAKYLPKVVGFIGLNALQRPHSRRAEWEADMAGLKLMALAGYDPADAAQAFRYMDEAHSTWETGDGWLPKALSLGSTHPRTLGRVEALEAEAEAMAAAGPEGLGRVCSQPPGYWGLM